MKAIRCSNFGPLDTLEYGEIADPVPKRGEVLVGIRASGVNYPDALLVQGLYQDKPPLPFIPGIEFAGDVVQLGEAASGLAVGDRVLGFNPGYGAFAEKVACPVTNIVPIPAALSYEDAANLVCAHGTAHHALKQCARIQPGETLLVLGAAGGTGIAAVQIGKAMGANVIAACSSEAKLAVASDNGADQLIDYSRQDLKRALRELTAGRGVDVVFDPVGGDAFDACSRSMARHGRLLVVGFASGTIPQLPVNLALVKEFGVIGVFWGSFVRHEPQLFRDNMNELFGWLAQDKVRVLTSERFPLSGAAEALQRLVDRQVIGKVTLVP